MKQLFIPQKQCLRQQYPIFFLVMHYNQETRKFKTGKWVRGLNKDKVPNELPNAVENNVVASTLKLLHAKVSTIEF